MLLGLLCDGLSYLLGRPLVPSFSLTMYATAEPKWLLWVAVVLAAPLFEEIFFRGFLFRGLSSSFMKPLGAILLTSALWAIIHIQYGWFEITYIFILGLMFGWARLSSGSLVVPIMMHALSNFLATAETAILSGF